jgi:hypothetical protein
VVNFIRIYDELIFAQAGGATDSPSIIRQKLIISRAQVAPGDSPTGDSPFSSTDSSGSNSGGRTWNVGFNSQGGTVYAGSLNTGTVFGSFSGSRGSGSSVSSSGNVNRLLEIEASYECWIDNTVTQPTDLESFYSTIQEFMIDQIKSILNVKSVAITQDRPTFDLDDNRITSSITAVAATTSGLVEYSQEVEDISDPGIVLVPAWTGNGLSKFAYKGPKTLRQTITEKALYFGGGGFAPGSPRGALGNPAGNEGKMAERVLRVRRRPVQMGVGANTIDLMDCTRVTEREFYIEIGPRVQVTGP